jgi:hypothetical protein
MAEASISHEEVLMTRLHSIARLDSKSSHTSNRKGVAICRSEIAAPPASAESGPHQFPPASLREITFGMVEAGALIGIFVATILHPELIMFVVMATVGFMVALLAIWDDQLREHRACPGIRRCSRTRKMSCNVLLKPDPKQRVAPPNTHFLKISSD